MINFIYTLSLRIIQSFQPLDTPIFLQKFLRDPFANSIAILVLLGMTASVIGVAVSYIRETQDEKSRWPKWLLPTLSLIGAGVAAYLLYVEYSGDQAICGPAGDCNAVQESPYSKLFGYIPVGLFGLVGYLLIFSAWLLKIKLSGPFGKLIDISIWAMAWFGIAFSIYLTFLEPFVIGATCLWCISSAIIITMILWVSTPDAKQALKIDDSDWDAETDDEN